MRTIAAALLVVMLMAAPALAGGWTSYDYSYTYNGYAYYDGTLYSGTWTYESSYSYMSNKNTYHYKGGSSSSFEATDGTLSIEAESSFHQNYGYHSANVYMGDSTYKYFDGDGDLLQDLGGTYHATYNANGELTHYKFTPNE